MGILNAQKLAFGEAQHDLDAAAAEVATTGGAGLTAAELGDLYLYRAMATARADWKATAAAPPDGGPHARRSTTTCARRRSFPNRVLNARELPPQVVADFQRAVEVGPEAAARHAGGQGAGRRDRWRSTAAR